MSYQLLIISLKWLPTIFFGIVFILAVFLYFNLKRFNPPKLPSILWRLNLNILISVSVIFRVFYAFLLTVSQYYTWSKQGLGSLLISSPLDNSLPAFLNKFPFIAESRWGYFLFYSFGRFWLNVLISIGVAFVFYLFLKFLKKYRERFFVEGETELGFLTALIVGWPNFVVFIPCVFVFVILMSVFRGLFLKESYTTLGWPFILAALIMLIWGGKLIQTLGLGVLKI